jgi:FkbM family methyltransferase
MENDSLDQPPVLELWEEEKIAGVSKRIAELSSDSRWKRRVFIDCGFNTCRVLSTFMRYLPKEFKIYGFDILEELAPRARQFERDNCTRAVSLEFAAVSDFDGTIPFVEVNVWGPNYKGGASTMTSYLCDRKVGLSPKQGRAIDFSRWIQRKFDMNDFVAVKMDIEGSEYCVLEKMIADGTLNQVSLMMVEYHWKYFYESARESYRLRHERLLEKLNNYSHLELVEWH